MVADVKPVDDQVGGGETRVYPGMATLSTSYAVNGETTPPIARALSVLDRLL